MKKNQPENHEYRDAHTQQAHQAAFALKIRQHLQQGTEQLHCDITKRLKLAREHALSQQKKESEVMASAPAVVYLPAAVNSTSRTFWKPGLMGILSALTLVSVLLGVNQWQEAERINELAEIDALILADDLPLHAHLDPGFMASLQPGE
jgi:hypothetical protein